MSEGTRARAARREVDWQARVEALLERMEEKLGALPAEEENKYGDLLEALAAHERFLRDDVLGAVKRTHEEVRRLQTSVRKAMEEYHEDLVDLHVLEAERPQKRPSLEPFTATPPSPPTAQPPAQTPPRPAESCAAESAPRPD